MPTVYIRYEIGPMYGASSYFALNYKTGKFKYQKKSRHGRLQRDLFKPCSRIYIPTDGSRYGFISKPVLTVDVAEFVKYYCRQVFNRERYTNKLTIYFEEPDNTVQYIPLTITKQTYNKLLLSRLDL